MCIKQPLVGLIKASCVDQGIQKAASQNIMIKGCYDVHEIPSCATLTMAKRSHAAV
jgi:hypothetical protein